MRPAPITFIEILHYRAGGESENIPLTGLLEGDSPVPRQDDVTRAMKRRSVNLKKCKKPVLRSAHQLGWTVPYNTREANYSSMSEFHTFVSYISDILVARWIISLTWNVNVATVGMYF